MDDVFVILDARRELILRSWLPSLRVLAEGGDREAQKRLLLFTQWEKMATAAGLLCLGCETKFGDSELPDAALVFDGFRPNAVGGLGVCRRCCIEHVDDLVGFVRQQIRKPFPHLRPDEPAIDQFYRIN